MYNAFNFHAETNKCRWLELVKLDFFSLTLFPKKRISARARGKQVNAFVAGWAVDWVNKFESHGSSKKKKFWVENCWLGHTSPVRCLLGIRPKKNVIRVHFIYGHRNQVEGFQLSLVVGCTALWLSWFWASSQNTFEAFPIQQQREKRRQRISNGDFPRFSMLFVFLSLDSMSFESHTQVELERASGQHENSAQILCSRRIYVKTKHTKVFNDSKM